MLIINNYKPLSSYGAGSIRTKVAYFSDIDKQRKLFFIKKQS